jgi:hypothetical protein
MAKFGIIGRNIFLKGILYLCKLIVQRDFIVIFTHMYIMYFDQTCPLLSLNSHFLFSF